MDYPTFGSEWLQTVFFSNCFNLIQDLQRDGGEKDHAYLLFFQIWQQRCCYYDIFYLCFYVLVLRFSLPP